MAKKIHLTLEQAIHLKKNIQESGYVDSGKVNMTVPITGDEVKQNGGNLNKALGAVAGNAQKAGQNPGDVNYEVTPDAMSAANVQPITNENYTILTKSQIKEAKRQKLFAESKMYKKKDLFKRN